MKSDKIQVKRDQSRLEAAAMWIVFAVITVCNMLPFLWGFITSIKTTAEINTFPPKFVGFEVNWQHYATVLGSNFPRSLLNSVIYSILAIVICAVCSVMFAYHRNCPLEQAAENFSVICAAAVGSRPCRPRQQLTAGSTGLMGT